MTEVTPIRRSIALDKDRRHPLYADYTQTDDFLRRSYRGGEDYAPGLFLDKYLRESADQYEARKDRAYYLNFVAAVVDSHISAVFRREPTREVTGGVLQEFVADATGEGDNLSDFVRGIMTYAVAALKAYVIVDIDEGGKPYAHEVHPANLLDWARDRRTGEYLWALIAEEHIEESDPFADRVEGQRYRLWTPDEWMLFEEDGGTLFLVDEQRNTAGTVPLLDAMPGNLPLPMIDIARINRRVYNICSQIDEILVNVTFPQPYLQQGEDGVEGADGSQIASDVAPIVMGTTKMFLLPEGASMAPGYLTPPDGPIQRQMEERERLIAAIYSLAGLEQTAPETIKQPQSGVAKAYDFRETNARLGAIAQASEALEERIFELLGAYGFSGDANVAYRKDYNVRDFRLVLEDYALISETNLPPAAKRRSALELAGQIVEDGSPEEKDEVQKAVEGMPDSAFASPNRSPLESLLTTEPATGDL